MSTNIIVDFERPPVVETVLGLHFDPLTKFRNAHLGAFWKSLPPEWSVVADAGAIPDQVEKFEVSPGGSIGFGIKFTSQPEVRMQIRNVANDRMIQLQNGQLHYNWLGHGANEYARYPTIRGEFLDIKHRFDRFVDLEAIGTMQPLQWEVSYVNQIPKGEAWNSPEDWGRLFRGVSIPVPNPGGTRPESFSGEWHFEIGDKQGRLHVKISHGRRMKSVTEEVIAMKLTARGPIDKSKHDALMAGLDLGRETIVRAFRDLTSDQAHQIWRIRSV